MIDDADREHIVFISDSVAVNKLIYNSTTPFLFEVAAVLATFAYPNQPELGIKIGRN
ncbi:hypothetical protein VAE308_1050138 [Vibrio aestuarianus]|uniref:Uncharacterized protein n=1 Tax=Vibrio aestuarianus TaxID=28171 RepID=A0ABN8TQL3_9VIBR|nr:hypothetical protein VAE308_1050138 [Vibrio aestuarianus]CAH8223968.1 hypothetical protein VAE063_940139 [Vibrio aestuarianus]